MFKTLRDKIKKIDNQILALIQERGAVVLELAKQKSNQQSPIYLPDREQEVYHFLDNIDLPPMQSIHLRNIYREIMSAMIDVQKKLEVAYLGPAGTFTHQASLKKFGHSIHLEPMNTIDDIFHAISQNIYSYGVLPIENSTEGKVTQTLDAFMEYDVHIYAEIHLAVQHCFFSYAENLKDIRTVYTHPQAWAQCTKWLQTNLSEVNYKETTSTARAAEILRDHATDSSIAIIASQGIQNIYKIPLYEKNIQDNLNNTTRFIVISKNPSKPGQANRTSVLFSLPHKPGSLYQALKPLFEENINLTNIESRPNKLDPWSYVFYVDVQGSCDNIRFQNVFEKVKQRTTFFKILGSYPIDVA